MSSSQTEDVERALHDADTRPAGQGPAGVLADEVRRLRADGLPVNLVSTIVELCAERDALRAEVRRLHARIAELTAEAELLRTERDTARARGVTDGG